MHSGLSKPIGPGYNTWIMDNRSAAVKIIEVLREAGHEAYLVGGCVRDMLLGRQDIDEHDVATSARPQAIQALFRRTRLVGAQFGVVLVGMGGQWIEVASFRTDESYSDGRHPDRVRFATLEEDAARRDFTINGMYYDPLEDRLIDLVGGRADLRAGLIRAIGEPDRRFREDHLRLLRAVRFAARLAFAVENRTAAAIRSQTEQIQEISTERILDELRKMLTRTGRMRGLRLADELGLLPYVLPELTDLRGRPGVTFAEGHEASAAGDAFDHSLMTVDRLGPHVRFETVFAAVLHLTGLMRSATIDRPRTVRTRVKTPEANTSAQVADDVCRRLTCSNRQRHAVVWLIHHLPLLGLDGDLSLAQIKRIMLCDGYDELIALYRARVEAGLEPSTVLEGVEHLAETIDREALRQTAPLIHGGDLEKALGVPPGLGYQEVLDEVFDAQLNGQVETKAEALALARSIAEKVGLV